MIRFPSISQFKNVCGNVHKKLAFTGLNEDGKPTYASTTDKPKLSFHGTVKMHGTNAAIVYEDGQVSYQSRERVLTLEEDNMGFVAHMTQHAGAFNDRMLISAGYGTGPMAVYGEWCGGNIQNNVALTGLPKMFVIFAVSYQGEWLDIRQSMKGFSDPAAGIYNVESFPSRDIEIDMEDPKEAQNALGELTMAVEKECPVGKAFGVSGTGEGIVWRCVTPGWNSSDYWFKVKGTEHSASKVKTLAAVDIERHRLVVDFIDATVTEQRLEQGLQHLVREQLKPFSMESLGDFLRWVIGDIVKEESDTMEANGFAVKELGGGISNKAKKWFITKLNSEKEAA